MRNRTCLLLELQFELDNPQQPLMACNGLCWPFCPQSHHPWLWVGSKILHFFNKTVSITTCDRTNDLSNGDVSSCKQLGCHQKPLTNSVKQNFISFQLSQMYKKLLRIPKLCVFYPQLQWLLIYQHFCALLPYKK